MSLRITINGVEVRRFTGLVMNIRFNSLTSDFSLQVPFDPGNKDDVAMLKPFSRHRVVIEENGKRLFTGVATSHVFTDSATPVTVPVTGYSLPGVLERADIPEDVANDMSSTTLRRLAETLLKPFGLALVVDGSVADVVDVEYSVASRPDDKIQSLLNAQCKAKGVLLTHDEYGNVVMTRVQAGAKPAETVTRKQRGDDSIPKEFISETVVPVYQATHAFSTGMPNVSMMLVADSQNMHSDITSLVQTDMTDKQATGKAIVGNPYCQQYCPRVIRSAGGKWSDDNLGARDALGDELQAVQVKIELSDWAPAGKLVRVNTLVSVQSAAMQLPRARLFFVESVGYRLGTESATGAATVNCVLPEVYTREEVKSIF